MRLHLTAQRHHGSPWSNHHKRVYYKRVSADCTTSVTDDVVCTSLLCGSRCTLAPDAEQSAFRRSRWVKNRPCDAPSYTVS